MEFQQHLLKNASKAYSSEVPEVSETLNYLVGSKRIYKFGRNVKGYKPNPSENMKNHGQQNVCVLGGWRPATYRNLNQILFPGSTSTLYVLWRWLGLRRRKGATGGIAHGRARENF
jgi:hypothetical protein